MRKTESQKIALCGMLGALSVVLLLLGSALQIGTYAARAGGVPVIPVLEEYGTRYALTLYVCVAILAVLFVPETELALFYVLVMGYYPVLRVKLNGVKSTLLRWLLKFAVSTRARCWCIFCCLRCSDPPCWTSCWPTASGCWQHCWPRATCRSGCVTAHWRH